MSKTRLTKAMREEIVTSVLKATDFESKKTEFTNYVSEQVRSVLFARVPKEFRDMIKGQPATWFRHASSVHFDTNKAPLCGLYDESGNLYYYNRRVEFEPFPVPVDFDECFSKEMQEQFEPMRKEAENLRDAHFALRDGLHAFLCACTTVEQVLEKMPELKKHIPAKLVFFAPVVNTNNLFSLLTKAGFDNTVEN